MEYIKLNENQEIKGETEYIMTEYEKTVIFDVWAEDKKNKRTYTIKFMRNPNVYLKNIELPGYNLFPEFTEEETNYTISLPKDREISFVNIFATAWDKASQIEIEGQDNIGAGKTVTITVTNAYVAEPMVYKITCVDSDTVNNYAYKAAYEEFIVPYTGIYKFEVWGARGGRSRINGGLSSSYAKGGYATGEILLKKGEKYYVYVGQQGTDAVCYKDAAATWNGGGLGTWDRNDDEAGGAGGGATDIRLVSGNWNDTKGLASRIIVAGRRRRRVLDLCCRTWRPE